MDGPHILEPALDEADILVYRPGTEVVLSPDTIPAKIVAVSIYGERDIRYLCVWWEGYARHKEWLLYCEVKAIGEPSRRVIGFALEDGE